MNTTSVNITLYGEKKQEVIKVEPELLSALKYAIDNLTRTIDWIKVGDSTGHYWQVYTDDDNHPQISFVKRVPSNAAFPSHRYSEPIDLKVLNKIAPKMPDKFAITNVYAIVYPFGSRHGVSIERFHSQGGAS